MNCTACAYTRYHLLTLLSCFQMANVALLSWCVTRSPHPALSTVFASMKLVLRLCILNRRVGGKLRKRPHRLLSDWRTSQRWQAGKGITNARSHEDTLSAWGLVSVSSFQLLGSYMDLLQAKYFLGDIFLVVTLYRSYLSWDHSRQTGERGKQVLCCDGNYGKDQWSNRHNSNCSFEGMGGCAFEGYT